MVSFQLSDQTLKTHHKLCKEKKRKEKKRKEAIFRDTLGVAYMKNHFKVSGLSTLDCYKIL